MAMPELRLRHGCIQGSPKITRVCSLISIPRSLFPRPYSLFPVFLFPAPCSLIPVVTSPAPTPPDLQPR